MEWLRLIFSGVINAWSEDEIGYVFRGYLLYILRCTLFVNKTCTRVPICFLALLWDLDKVHTYAWGARALAYIYRQLGIASRIQVKQMTGYITLLEEWFYKHFCPLEPHCNMDYLDDQPHMQRWRPCRERGSLGDNLRALETIG